MGALARFSLLILTEKKIFKQQACNRQSLYVLPYGQMSL